MLNKLVVYNRYHTLQTEHCNARFLCMQQFLKTASTVVARA